jgi:hypothetical protein
LPRICLIPLTFSDKEFEMSYISEDEGCLCNTAFSILADIARLVVLTTMFPSSPLLKNSSAY